MLGKIDRAISRFEDALSVVLFLFMVAIVCWSVLCRYLFEIPFLQGEELARFFMIYIVYIGTSIGVRAKTHIGVEVFVDMLSPSKRSYVKIVTEIIGCLMFILLFGLSLQMCSYYLQTGQTTTTTNIPVIYVFACVPLGFAMSIIHYIYEISNLIKEKVVARKEQSV